MIIVVMGVSGAGKSTLGRALAAELGWDFLEGDAYHPNRNVRKMRSGCPLNDADRRPWLVRLHRVLAGCSGQGRNAVLSCSALKAGYRDLLRGDLVDVRFVFLHGDPALILERSMARKRHFMPPELLDSQLDELEPPEDAAIVSIALSTDEQVGLVCRAMGIHEGR